MNDKLKYNNLLQIIDSNINEGIHFEAESLLYSLLENDASLHQWIEFNTMVQEGKTYMIPDDKLYKAIGILRIIFQQQIKIRQLSKETISKLHNIIPYLKQALKKIEEKPSLIFQDNEFKPDEIANVFAPFIRELEDKSISYRNQQLIDETISNSKIDEFKKMIQKQWENSRTLSKVFEFYNAVQYNPPEKLQWVGLHKIRFRGAKIMFVEKNFQEIYGIEWGYEVSNEVVRFFIQRLKENQNINSIETESYLKGFDQIINANPEINVAFISFSNFYTVARPLGESGHFTDSSDTDVSIFTFPVLGIYKERLVIVPLKNKTMPNGIIAFKLPGSIIMKRRTNESWINEKLQLEVKEITDENVNQVILDSNPNADVSNPKILEEAKTGILIELDETIDFQISDPKSIIIITITS